MSLAGRATLTALSLSLVVGTTGCARKRLEPWTPKPTVQWHHVATSSAEPVWDGYQILAHQPTRGLFPASMAVTRVAIEVDSDKTGAGRPFLYTDPRNEFLQWNRALDDQMAISEVFPIVERDLGGGEADPSQIMAAARAFHARLNLIYAVNELSRTETEVFGVLYDATTMEPIASMHARAFSGPPRDDEADDAPVDLWKTDSWALVRERFDGLVHACIRQLILSDEQETVKPPEGWTPAGPIRPVEWPPRHLRTGR